MKESTRAIHESNSLPTIVLFILLSLSAKVTATDDIVTIQQPGFELPSPELTGLLDILVICAADYGMTGLNPGIGPTGYSLNDVPIYNISDDSFAPTVDAYGGAVPSIPPYAPGTSAPYLGIKHSTVVEALHGGFTEEVCIGFGALLIHELQHEEYGTWFWESCFNQSDPLACVACWSTAINCMKDNDPTGQDEDWFEESRADFMSFLCLCKQACALPPGPARDALQNSAISALNRSIKGWNTAQIIWASTCSSVASSAGCGSAYPAAPLDPDGGSTPYEGPFDSNGDPLGVTGSSCDCQYQPLEGDPCD